MTQLTVWQPGIVTLRFAVTARRAVRELLGQPSECVG
jgi:hypothetical protein